MRRLSSLSAVASSPDLAAMKDKGKARADS